MVDIDALIASSAFWDDALVVFGVIAGLAAVIVIGVDIPGLIKSTASKTVLRWGCAVALIVGVTGQITSARRISGLTGEIIAFVNDRAATANRAAGEANDRAEKAGRDAELARLETAQARLETEKVRLEAAEAVKAAAQANERAAQAHERAAVAEERGSRANERALGLELLAAQQERDIAAQKAAQKKEVDDLRRQVEVREISETQSTAFVKIGRGRGQIILILPNEPEPRSYGAERVMPLLRKAGYTVRTEDLKGTSQHTGLIVCANGAEDIKLYRGLNRAKIQVRLFRANMKNRPSFCEIPFATERTMRVFVGQRTAPGSGPARR